MDMPALKILFVEDSPEDAELVTLALQREGFEVSGQRVETERQLREALASWCPDVILSDYSMPAFNGLHALELSIQLAPDVPFIFVSGTIGEEWAIESIHKGATDYVLKDNIRRLSTSIRRAVNDSLERRRAREVEKERSRLAAILEATTDLVAIAGPDGAIEYLNQGARDLLGLAGDGPGLSLKDLHASWTWEFMETQIRGAVARGGIWQGEGILAARDGIEIPVSQVVISHGAQEGEVEYLSLIARDIRDRKAFEERIQYLANYDSLTELPNRSLLSDRTDQAIAHASRTGRLVALLVVNIDRFNLVNNGYGRKVGDLVLQRFAGRLRETLRAGDTVARLSGDSFAVLAPELASPDDVLTVVRKIQAQLEEPFLIEGGSFKLTIGIGISVHPRDGDDFGALLGHADAAMHRAKEEGENAFQFYTEEMTSEAAWRVRRENEVRLALSRDELELYYQPQVDLNTGAVVGVEALLRWQHPREGLLRPDAFVPLAESSDLIFPLGERALTMACRQMTAWQGAVEGLRVAVNVSPRQFLGEGFVDTVERVLSSAGLAPALLELEVTESLLLHDHEAAFEILARLNELGVTIALDDFGTGYSNLSYLSRLPIHCLKIDRAFVQRSLEDGNDAEIVRAIVSLADALELRVVAEGIEKLEQLRLLRRLNCGEGQGFLFSHPLPAPQIPALLAGEFAGFAEPPENG